MLSYSTLYIWSSHSHHMQHLQFMHMHILTHDMLHTSSPYVQNSIQVKNIFPLEKVILFSQGAKV
jgi:hypothetical protein